MSVDKSRPSRYAGLGGLSIAGLIAVATTFTFSFSALAARPTIRVAVVPVAGARSGHLERGVLRALASHRQMRTIPPDAVKRTLQELHLPLKSDRDFEALARALEVSALVVGETTGRSKIWVAIRNGADGSERAQATWNDSTMPSTQVIGRRFWKTFGRVLAKTTAPLPLPPVHPERSRGTPQADLPSSKPAAPLTLPPPIRELTPKPVDLPPLPRPVARSAPASVSAPATPEKSSERRPLILEASLGMNGFSRQLTFSGDSMGRSRDYRLSAALALAASFEWHVWALSPEAFLTRFSLTASGEKSLGLTSVDSAGKKYDTTAYRYDVGARYALPLGEYSDLGAAVGYGVSVFALSPTGSDPPSAVPDTSYRYARVGPVGKIGITRAFSLQLGASYLFILDSGAISSPRFYPRLTVSGLEGTVAFVYRLTGALDVQVMGEVHRFSYKLGSQPGDAFVATGAVDQYLAASLRLGARLE